MKIFLSLLIAFFCFIASYSQQVVWKSGNKAISISDKIHVLKDKDGLLTIQDVSSSNYYRNFTLSDQKILHFGFSESAYWLKLLIENQTGDKLYLELAHAFIPSADLFYKDSSGRWQSMQSGYKIYLNKKIIKTHYQTFPLPENVNQFYIRVIPYMHPISVKLWSAVKYDTGANRQRMVYGIYVGILLFAIAINLFLFFAFRKLYYLFYSILVFLYILSAAAVLEGFIIYFSPKANLMYWYKTVPVLDMPALLLYCMSFLELKDYSKKLYQLSVFACCFILFYFVLIHFLPLIPTLIVTQILALLVFILAITIGVVVGRKGNRLGYYFALAYSIWFFLLAAELSYIQFGIPAHLFDISYVSVAIFIEAFLLAFLLVKRFLWEKKDDERIRFEMQANMINLEQKFKQEMLQTQLEIQEHTLANISQELHDNICQTLTLSKLNLITINADLPDKDNQKLTESKNLLSEAIQSLRDLSKTMNTDYVSAIGLSGAIEQQLQILQKTGLFSTHFNVSGEALKFEQHKELLLYRVIQESLNNIVKHAEATEIFVQIRYVKDEILISVSDNGKGFDLGAMEAKKTKGLGLINIFQRVKLIGGDVTIESKSGQGTLINIKATGGESDKKNS